MHSRAPACSSMNIFVHLPSLQWFRVEVLGWYQILWFIGLIEGSGFFSGKYGLGFMKDATMSGTPGDYGVGFPTFLGKVSDPAVKKSKLNAELANGRLAMMAIIGMFFQDGVVLSVLHVLCMFFPGLCAFFSFACSLHVLCMLNACSLHVLSRFFARSLRVLCLFQVSCDLIVIVLSAFPVNLQRFWSFNIGFNMFAANPTFARIGFRISFDMLKSLRRACVFLPSKT